MKKVAILENTEGLGDFFERGFSGGEAEKFRIWTGREFPDDDFDGYIFTGDYANITEGLDPHHEDLLAFYRMIKEGRRVFASCFSHQLLAVEHGGKVELMPERHFGWHEHEIDPRNPLAEGLAKPVFFSLNAEAVTKKPETAQIVAQCRNQAYQLLQLGKNTITCQSHPEILKQDAIGIIMENQPIKKGVQLSGGFTERTSGLSKADDRSSIRFMHNLVRWLRG